MSHQDGNTDPTVDGKDSVIDPNEAEDVVEEKQTPESLTPPVVSQQGDVVEEKPTPKSLALLVVPKLVLRKKTKNPSAAEIATFKRRWQTQFLRRVSEMESSKVTRDSFFEPMKLITSIQNMLVAFYRDAQKTGVKAANFGDPKVKLTEPNTRFHTCNPFFNAACFQKYTDEYLDWWKEFNNGISKAHEFGWARLPQEMKDKVNSVLERKAVVDNVATEVALLTGHAENEVEEALLEKIKAAEPVKDESWEDFDTEEQWKQFQALL